MLGVGRVRPTILYCPTLCSNIMNSSCMHVFTYSTPHLFWDKSDTGQRTGHLSSYAESKKIKSLTLHTHGCLRANSLRGIAPLLILHLLLFLLLLQYFMTFNWLAILITWIIILRNGVRACKDV